MRIGWLVSLTALGAVGTIGVAIAQAPGEAAGDVIYEQSYFAPFAPRTALDMVLRVPGFSLNEGEERRGFAGAQSNVLIDGAPPTSKAQEIDDILARIPASDVERIELIRGSDSIAASAQSTRVNIVRRAGGGGGVWELSAEQAADGRVSPGGEAAWSGRAGSVRYGGSADLDIAHLPIRGVRVDHDEAGAVEQRRVERVPTEEREARLAGEAAFPFHGGQLALNAQLSRVEAEEREAATLLDAAGAPAGAIAGALDEAEDIAELGASFSRRIGDWQTQSAAVITRRRFTADEGTSEYDAAGALREAADQRQRLTAGETIVRVTGERPLTRAWRVKASVEAAFNTLEQRLMLTVDVGAGPTPVDLPSANVRVEEERAEASAMLAATFPAGWSVEAGLAVEASRLTQSGDADRRAELAYWKPSIQVVRALGERNQVRLRLYRDVGQLDFEDFVSVADITSSLVDAGNPDLRPETSWRIELGGDWRFAEEGAINLTLYRWAIEDALDIVPLGPPDDRLDAPGNIGAATAYGARVSLALPLPWDAELRLDGFAQRSEATDPLTGEERSLSEFEESALTIGNDDGDVSNDPWDLNETERQQQDIQQDSYGVSALYEGALTRSLTFESQFRFAQFLESSTEDSFTTPVFDGDPEEGERELIDVDDQEILLDGSLTFDSEAFAQQIGLHSFEFEVGVAGGVKTRDFSLTTFEDGGDGSFDPGDLVTDPGASGQFNYEERRLDGFVQATLGLAEGVRFQAGGRVENTESESSLLSGGAPTENDSSEFYPSMHLQWDVLEDGQFRASFARTVRRPLLDQLVPFEDEESPGDDDITIGNPDLGLETAWGYDVGYEHRIGERGVIGVNFFNREVSDLISLVSTGVPSGVGTGSIYTFANIGDGRVWGWEVDVSTPLSFIGLDETGLFANYTDLDSERTDPFTGHQDDVQCPARIRL